MKFVVTFTLFFSLLVSLPASADVAKGQSTYAAKGCIGCHGAAGKSVVPTYPSLVGRSGDFVRKNLTDFRSGARKNPVMNAMSAGLKDEDINNLADYINSLK
ncbi:MAG: cytochrome c553 [Planctomycetota bacterium]|jgi:cytochrome c553